MSWDLFSVFWAAMYGSGEGLLLLTESPHKFANKFKNSLGAVFLSDLHVLPSRLQGIFLVKNCINLTDPKKQEFHACIGRHKAFFSLRRVCL